MFATNTELKIAGYVSAMKASGIEEMAARNNQTGPNVRPPRCRAGYGLFLDAAVFGHETIMW